MRIGILAYRQEPYISANTAIAYLVGEQIAKTDEVVYIGRKQDEKQNYVHSHNDIKVRYLNDIPKNTSTHTENLVRRAGFFRLALLSDINGLRRIAREEYLDVLICVSAPNEDALISAYADLSIPVFLYQLDPYYDHMDIESKRLKEEFLRILPKFKFIFTTELLLIKYKEDIDLRRYLDRMEVVQFPKLIKVQRRDKEESNTITLLYAGSLYQSIRSPEILIKLKRILPDNCRLVFCGSCDQEADLKRLEEKGVICKGYCSQDVLADETADADFLVNIGNTVHNQLGSKIIDYIATGKPIINLIQLKDCPTIPVLHNYDYQLTLETKELIDKKELLKEFIEMTRGKCMDWEEVVRRYNEYTPKYVAEQLMNRIRSNE